MHKAGELQQLLVVGGDLNSFVDVEIDSWGGHYNRTPVHSLPLGRTWPSGHVQIPSSSPESFHLLLSSRICQPSGFHIWWLPCPQVEVQLLHAAIFWQWDRRVDHDPVLVDLALHLPEASNSPYVSPPWRSLVRGLDGDLPASIPTTGPKSTHLTLRDLQLS